MRSLRFLASLSPLWAVLLLAGEAPAAECDSVSFPDSVSAGGGTLALNGLGIRKATMLKVHVYVAGLYLPAASGNAASILGADEPWQLVLHFVRDVDGSDIRDAFQEGFEHSSGAALATLQPRVDALNAMVVDFKEGQQLTFTNMAGKGVTVDVNGAGGGEIDGTDFSAALLSIWIGEKPPNAELRTGLLGGGCG
jgi:hypothetical protein